MHRSHLNLQVCVYPYFDGGFYISGPHGPLNRMARIGLGVIDFRIWWVSADSHKGGKEK